MIVLFLVKYHTDTIIVSGDFNFYPQGTVPVGYYNSSLPSLMMIIIMLVLNQLSHSNAGMCNYNYIAVIPESYCSIYITLAVRSISYITFHIIQHLLSILQMSYC